MEQPQKKRKRRRCLTVPGRDYTRDQEAVAVLLSNTYRIEYARCMTNLRDIVDAKMAGQWRRELSSHLRSDGRHSSVENIDDRDLADAAAKRKYNFWIKLAREVQSRGYDPELFVRRVFDARRHGDPPPGKHVLGQPDAFRFYEEAGRRFVNELYTAFQTQQAVAAREIAVVQQQYGDAQRAWSIVLNDLDTSLSALFRYCLARSIAAEQGGEVFMKTADRFKTTAALQYIRDAAAYDKVFGDKWIPADFAAEAPSIYAKQYGKEVDHGAN